MTRVKEEQVFLPNFRVGEDGKNLWNFFPEILARIYLYSKVLEDFGEEWDSNFKRFLQG